MNAAAPPEHPGRIAAFGLRCDPVREADLPLLCAWRNSPAVTPFMDDGRPVNERVLLFWLRRIRRDGSVLPWLARHGEEPVGYFELKNLDPARDEAEFGIFLSGERWRGTGMARRMALCCELALERLGIRRLRVCIREGNARSRAFFSRLGGRYSHTDGPFQVYVHEFAARRRALAHVAGALGLAAEFSQRFAPAPEEEP